MERHIRLEYMANEELQKRDIEIKPGQRTGYRVNSADESLCFCVWVDDVTYIIPLQNLALVEMKV